MKKIKEGSVQVYIPGQPNKPKQSSAFYNPKMELNRDLSIAVARIFFKNKKIKVCEPLAASGIRGLRYSIEVPGTEVVMGDIKQSAVDLIKKNIKLNKCKNAKVFRMHANELLAKGKFDLVDIDPFGTPSPFINSVLQAVKINGLLAVTATDMRPLCGVSPKGKMPKYDNANSLRTEYCHETAVRVLIGLVARRAKDKKITPLISMSTDHYLRVFLKISKGKNTEIGYLNHCFECGNRNLSKNKKKKCKCKALYEHAGPLWTGKLWDKKFCERVLFESNGRLFKIMSLIVEESEGKPLFYTTRELYKREQVPKMETVLKKFKGTRTHFKPEGIRLK